ncbi:transmembrane anchor protein [Aromatoleum diolicum]|uniref:Transmembrane anchor protein n=1 Tax=Aromatoleum diolicum TaxID=75796 RepID=A0ABX1QCT2_9RHOO|nr:transmembrane anchor protein [Aromatoleum diolicum]NMG76206.1 transmembrane anchor protein [Aromatoleum diolicum]
MYNTDLPTRAELPSTGKLLRSTAVAALIATGLLVTTILPAEYGIDPTGAGRALGLTQMGEIKISLANEAKAGEASPAGGVAPIVAPATPAAAAVVTAPAPDGHEHGHEHEHEHTAVVAPAVPSRSEPAAAEGAPARQHTVTISLKPGEAAEIKLTMQKDASVSYEWSTVGGPVNYDTHGDPVKAPKGFYHGYGKGKNETADAGTLQAAFDGKHGWFWRNRSGAEITVTLKTRGDYGQIERML